MSRGFCFPAIWVLVAIALGAVPAEAQRQQVPVGPRAIALGGAFSAVADDYSALFWNPAGLVRIGHQEIAGNTANLFGSDIIDNYLAFVLPFTRNHALAADWYHSGFQDPELDQGENRIDLAYGTNLHPKVSLGVGVKFLSRNTSLDGSTVRDGTGFGMDLGILAGPVHGVQVGLVGQDIFGTDLRYADGLGTAEAYPRSLRFATSYERRNWGRLNLDVDDRLHVGLEALPLDLLALRAGFQRSVDGARQSVWSFGAGFKVNILRFDYAYEIHPDLDNTSYLGATLAFSFNPAQIRIEQVHTGEIYASLNKTYANNPIGTVQVRNLKDEPLTVRLSVLVPGFMDTPTERELILRPGATQEIPLLAVFSGKLMELDEDRTLPVEVTASYRSARVIRSDKASAKAVVYSPGAINWGDGVAQAAAFVTPRDPVVESVAREAGRTVARIDEKSPFPNRNIAFCAAMFNAMDVLGLAYVPDPNNPYATMSETEHAVDVIHYPRETLQRRTGDCDDTSVLMCSMLGNVGVPTKLVDAPGHLMILAGTGMHRNQARGLAVDEYLYTIVDDEIWIPIETTALGGGFAEAWRTGAQSYQDWTARDRTALVDVSASQQRYEPALPGGREDAPSLDTADLEERIGRDSAVIAGWRKTYLESRYEEVEAPKAASSKGLNQLAYVYFVAKRYEEARIKLEEALALDSGSRATNNNLAALYIRQGQGGPAVERLAPAANREVPDPGELLNLGQAYLLLGDMERARSVLSEGIDRAGGVEGARSLLGSPAGFAGSPGDVIAGLADLARSDPGSLPVYWEH